MADKARENENWWFEISQWDEFSHKLMEGKASFFLPVYQWELALSRKIKGGNENNMTYLKVIVYKICEIFYKVL